MGHSFIQPGFLTLIFVEKDSIVTRFHILTEVLTQNGKLYTIAPN